MTTRSELSWPLPSEPLNGRRRRVPIPVAAGVVGFGVIAAILAAVALSTSEPRKPPPELMALAAAPAVVGLGYLEPETTVVRLAATGGGNGTGAKVGQLLAAEGDTVAAGQVLALLDTAPRLAAQIAASETQVSLKRLALEQKRADIASNLASRKAALARAQTALVADEAEYRRQRALVTGNVVSRASYDRALRDYANDRATVVEMEAALARIAASVAAADGARAEQVDVAVAAAELAGAEADLAVARAGLAEATIRAPFAGRILTVTAHAGELIGNAGLLEIGDVQHMRAVVEVYQTDFGRIHLGDPVTLRAEALHGPISGVVARIGAAVQRQTVINNDPATATDARVVQVFVALDAETSRAVAGLSRLQVRAIFR